MLRSRLTLLRSPLPSISSNHCLLPNGHMYDPLANAFANSSSPSSSITPQTAPVPAWPATSHNPFADGVILPKPSSPKPPGTPEKPPHSGLQGGPTNPYGKEPQVYGQPPSGMVSPQNNGNAKFERSEPYLRIRITGLDRNRRDILVRLDAQVRRQALDEKEFDQRSSMS